MINHHLLKNCLYKSGDNHSDMIGIKRFLNAYHGVRISDIPSGSDFCAKTQAALIQFQQSKGLSSTDGMNIETWQAIGEEIGAAQFEASFGSNPNVSTLRNVVFGNRIRTMFPTKTHTTLIQYAFEQGKGDGGLSASEAANIDYGSKLTDTYFGTGKWYDIPITLLISEAYKHAMTPEGMTPEAAQKEAYKWIEKNTGEAREAQRKIDVGRAEWDARKKQTPELGYLERIPLSSEMSSTGLTDFGRACHTYMDSVSPAHHGWKVYKIPKTIEVSGTGTNEKKDIPMFIVEGILHSLEESGDPTQEQRDECVLYMRGAFLTTFGNKWFCKAVKSNDERQKVYSFLKSKGLIWEEDLAPTNIKDIKDSPLPVKPRNDNFRNPGIGAVHYT